MRIFDAILKYDVKSLREHLKALDYVSLTSESEPKINIPKDRVIINLKYTWLCIYIYIYMRACVGVCLCVCAGVCVCVCECGCVYVCVYVCTNK